MHLRHFLTPSVFAATAAAAPSAATTEACKEISKAIPGRVSLPFTINYNEESTGYWSTLLREIKPACNIVAWEMVNWNGTIVNINAETQPDLAVALRGSGSQFVLEQSAVETASDRTGIVTQFTVKAYPIGKVWGGTRVYDESKTEELYKAMHKFIPYSNEDPKAAIIVTSLILTGGSKLNLLFYFYDGEQPPTSGPFADLLKIKSTLSSTKTQSYPALTATIPYFTSGSKVYSEIANKMSDITMVYFKQLRGLASQCSVDFQPLPAAIGRQTEKRGGNAIGFTASDPDRVLLEIQCAWTDKKYDESVRQFSKDLTSWIEEKLPEWIEEYGAPTENYLPLFMNDAMSDQNVTGTYKDYAKFKALQLEADPEGVLRERMGGFKY
ncbi:LOW QUALITY PROTEIN: FAD-binding PCMH-type domain-containing protein [Fusarium acuminatum]|uniref:FAD-binding PCMH-type domain-containing protein n=1 Tax=Fusarium acuminatum TaxID=5515 RepID=A0ABZ2WLA6_9HYPO